MIKNGDIVSNRYTIKSHIGRGGMQEVFLAHDQLLNMNVAIKTPQPGQATKRFKNSAIIAAKVNHHNVAKTFDYIEEENSVFLIEEFVDGLTLEQKQKKFGVFDPHLAALILHKISKGLQASHKAGVIHRDLKPSNIMISAGMDFENLKITDFGIATLTEELFNEAQKAGDLTNSASGTIKGALPYMSPEMMFGDIRQKPSFPTDIWSLGAMMFQLLTGDYPFGIFLDAAVNVKTNNRLPWPNFMIQNPQFRPLAIEIQRVIDSCLTYDQNERPSADELALKCRDLCYLSINRQEGIMSNFIQNGHSAFANTPEGGIFLSMESVYGPKKPNLNENNKICFSSFPGEPRCRAHPVTVLNC